MLGVNSAAAGPSVNSIQHSVVGTRPRDSRAQTSTPCKNLFSIINGNRLDRRHTGLATTPSPAVLWPAA